MNVPFRHIACCVEYESAVSEEVLGAARALREPRHGRLSVVHVVPPPIGYPGFPGVGFYFGGLDPGQVSAAAEEWLARIVHSDEEAVVLDGYPPTTTCTWAQDNGVDLLVVAATRGLVERVLLGSFASYVVRHSSSPVLIIRPEARDDDGANPAVAAAAKDVS